MTLHHRAESRRRPATPKPPLALAPAPTPVHIQALGSSERMFAALHRFTATNVTRVVTIEGALSPQELRTALSVLRARHPLLQARIEHGETPRFVIGDAPPVPLHVVRRRDDWHWKGYLEELLNKPLEHGPAPLFQLHYLQDERAQRSELILLGEHAACDGVSMNSLCTELLELCAGKSARNALPVRPVLEALLPPSPPLARALGIGAALGKVARVAVQRRLLEERLPARSSAFAFLSLSAEETARVIDNARWAGTTVTGALMAAALLTLAPRYPGAPRLSLSVPINLRPKLPQHALTAEDLGNYTSAVYLDSRVEGSLWELARAAKQQLDQQAQSDQLLSAVPLVYRAGRLFVRADRPPLAHLMVSNSGIVPLQQDYGTFRVLEFYSATSAPMVSADYCFFCNTLADRLCINLVFAREVVARDSAERALEEVRARLTQP